MPFRLSAKKLFLTYPSCPLAKSVVSDQLREIFSKTTIKIEHYAICQEKHQDGSLHLHCLLWLDGKANFKNARFADLRGESTVYHGKYEAMKKERESVLYVMKEDKSILTDSMEFIEKISNGKKRKMDEIAQALMDGQDLKTIAMEHPGIVALHKTKLLDFQKWILSENWKPSPWTRIMTENLTGSTCAILRWIGLNLFEQTRPLRTKNIYIHGPGGTGKSSLISYIEERLKTYKPTPQVKWWDGFNDTFELIVFDEFNGQWPLTEMNKILDGQRMIIPQRNGDFFKTQNIPVIICSNYPLEDIYTNVNRLAWSAFASRLSTIYIDTYFKIFE